MFLAFDLSLVFVDSGQVIIQYRLEVLTRYRANQDTRPWGNDTKLTKTAFECIDLLGASTSG